MVVGERYNRQEVLTGWDQTRLAGATLGIVGSGTTAFLCGLMATGMGFGRLAFIRGAGATGSSAGACPRFEDWPGLFGRINPDTRVLTSDAQLRPSAAGRLKGLDALIVAGNDARATHAASAVAARGTFPVMAGGGSGCLGTWGRPEVDQVTASLHRRPESAVLSQVVAALLVDDARKALMPLPGEEGAATRRNLLRLPALGAGGGVRHLPLGSSWRGVAVVGAGALGTWFGLCLGLSGRRSTLTIYDDDTIEESNLNRQILFYDAVGEPKATVLARRLHEHFPLLTANAYGRRADEAVAPDLARAAALVACPDNFGARAFLNTVARRYHRPLISGGTSPEGGSCVAYEPGKTSCLSCRFRIDQLAAQEREATSCGRHVEGSIVTSNAITGALMVWLLLGLEAGRAEPGLWEHEGAPADDRIGLRSPRPACTCHMV